MGRQAIKASASSTKLSFADPRFDRDIYADVATHAKLREIRLIGSEFGIKPQVLTISSADLDQKRSFEGGCKRYEFNAENGTALAFYSWTAELKVGRSRVLKLTAEYIMMYSDLDQKPEEYVELYVKRLARFSSYPYFRALFGSQTALSGIQIPPLPSLVERMD
jgi:hypothetical protein